MMINLKTRPVPDDEPLFGQSKWWGEVDLPEDMPYPEVTVTDEGGDTWDEPLTFICQIRCEDLVDVDPEDVLPHEGMLYFFAALDYFLGDLDAPVYPGMGKWPKECSRVLYAPSCDNLHTHHVVNADGTPACKPPEAIVFSHCRKAGDGLRLLGRPYLEEVRQLMPDMLNLLQIDEDDRWNLTFHDSGMLNFLIRPADLWERRWENVQCYMFSF